MSPRRLRTWRRGYTVIEVMIALTVLAIGTSGIIAMQKVTTVANRDAKNLVVADQIARTWMERLRTDAMQWNHPSPISAIDDIGETTWLSQVNTANNLWFRPAYSATFGAPTFDGLGNDVADGDPSGIYCTNLRLSWLYGPSPAVQPPYLIRAEVRVFWHRDGSGALPTGTTICDPGGNPALVDAAVENYHFVYIASAIRQNTAGI